MVVSAQKREQNQIDVPITLQAFSGDYVSKAGLQNLTDVSTLTPGFYVQNQSSQNPGLVMRGITDDNAGPTDEARVSVYQDGVSISRITTASTELFDVQRIEVAKGPQSTLFGRAALTGAVNIIQNKANEKGFDWNAKLEGGNYGYKDAEGMVNLPLSENLAIRLAGRFKTRDGYITNLLDPGVGNKLNSDNATAYRVAINYSTDNFTNDLLFNAEQDHNSGVDFKSGDFYPTNPATGAVTGDLSPYTPVALNPDASPTGTNHLFTHRKLIGVTNIASLKLGNGFKLTSTTAWRHDHFNERGDNGGHVHPWLQLSNLQLTWRRAYLSPYQSRSILAKFGSYNWGETRSSRFRIARGTGHSQRPQRAQPLHCRAAGVRQERKLAPRPKTRRKDLRQTVRRRDPVRGVPSN